MIAKATLDSNEQHDTLTAFDATLRIAHWPTFRHNVDLPTSPGTHCPRQVELVRDEHKISSLIFCLGIKSMLAPKHEAKLLIAGLLLSTRVKRSFFGPLAN